VDPITSNLVLFYLSRGHNQEEAEDYAKRHLRGDNSFVANEPPKTQSVFTEVDKKQV
jgi:hypothetical protein